MSTKKVKKLHSKRGWLEGQKLSGSWYKIDVFENGYANLSLADCYRNITWEFGVPGDKRAERKIKKIKAIIDELHNHLVTSDTKEESISKTKSKKKVKQPRLRAVS